MFCRTHELYYLTISICITRNKNWFQTKELNEKRCHKKKDDSKDRTMIHGGEGLLFQL